MTFAHTGILLYFTLWIDEYLVALNDFHRIHKQPVTSEGKLRHFDETDVAKKPLAS